MENTKKLQHLLSICLVIILLIISFTLTACYSNNPGADGEKDSNNGEQTVDPYKNYCSLVKSIGNNQTYKNYIANRETLNNAYFAPHPYKALEKLGIDVQSIREGKTECVSQSWFQESDPNTLYVATYAADPTNTFYYECLFSKKLNDDEKKDYVYLCNEKKFESSFMIQEIDFDVVSSTKVGIESHKTLKETTNNKTAIINVYGKYKNVDVIVMAYNPNNNFDLDLTCQTFKMIVRLSNATSYYGESVVLIIDARQANQPILETNGYLSSNLKTYTIKNTETEKVSYYNLQTIKQYNYSSLEDTNNK